MPLDRWLSLISIKSGSRTGLSCNCWGYSCLGKKHGTIPEGSVVMIRSDWYKKWSDVARFNQKPFPGITLDALKFLHLKRKILFHGHEPLDTDTTPTLEGEAWLLRNHYTQAEGVANLDRVPETGALVAIGFAKPEGGTGDLLVILLFVHLTGLMVYRSLKLLALLCQNNPIGFSAMLMAFSNRLGHKLSRGHCRDTGRTVSDF